MLSSILFVLWVGLTPQEVKTLLNRVPLDWYTSTTRLFEYCHDVEFQHPICPRVKGRGDIDFESEFFSAPFGPLTARSLFQAAVLYQVKRPPDYWFVSLGLEKERPVTIEPRLWAEARWLWAKILFEQRKYKESLKFFDDIVEDFRGKPVFHQQRAWAQFFNGQFDRAMGSIVSAESPLLVPVPFFEKFFLRALVEKESCQPTQALATISVGRNRLTFAQSPSTAHPWVILCERRGLGDLCPRLRSWYDTQFGLQIKRALEDLDLLEIELRDMNSRPRATEAKSDIVWASINGESWADELGYYVVPVVSKCS